MNPVEFKLEPNETAIIQLADGRELELGCVKTTGTQATLTVAPGGDVKRVMKVVAQQAAGGAK